MDKSPTRRFQYLDSMRGIAAFLVFWYHSPLSSGTDPYWMIALYDGPSAVMLFFVLSGFVLSSSLSHINVSLRNTVAFIARRALRIYPAYYVSLVVCALVHLADNSFSAYTTAFILEQSVLHVFLILPRLDIYFLNGPIWTLVVEMRIAFIFPALYKGLTRLKSINGALALTLLGAIGCCAFPSLAGSVAFLPLFLLGGIAFQLNKKMGDSLGFKTSLALIVVGGFLYGTTVWLKAAWAHPHAHTYAAGLGSALIILGFSSNPTLRKPLESPMLAAFGTASYGFYLFHVPMLDIADVIFGEQRWLVFFSALVMSFVAAVACGRYVEKPFIRFASRRFTYQ